MRNLSAIVKLETRLWQWLVLLFLAFIWGTSFILMKKGLLAFSGTQVGALRMFLGALFLLPIAIKNLSKLNRQNLLPLFIVGFVGNAIPALLFATAQTKINSSLAGMLNSLTPLFTMLVGVIMYKTLVNKTNVLGIFVGLIGAVGLIFKDSGDLTSGLNIFALLPLVATFFYGISTNMIKENLKMLKGPQIASLALFLIMPLAFIYLLYTDILATFESGHFVVSFLSVTVLSMFSTALAVVVFNALIKQTSAIFASSVTYLIPVFAIIWGIFDGERIYFHQILWIAVILSGIYLVNRKSTLK